MAAVKFAAIAPRYIGVILGGVSIAVPDTRIRKSW